MGATHARGLARLPGVTVAGIVSPDRPAARRLARELATRAFDTLREARRSVRANAVWVCVPTAAHRPVVLEAAAGGLHVFSEKPIAASLREAEAILRGVRKAGVRFMVGHVLRFFPEFASLRDLVRNGTLGAPGVVRMSRGGKYPSGYGNWYANLARSGGPLLDLVIHDFDWLRWTFGPVRRVHARVTYGRRPVPQAYTLTLLRMASGPMAHVEGFWGHDLPFRVGVEIAGSRGMADYDSAASAALTVHRAAERPGQPSVAVPESPLALSPYEAEDRHFVKVIREGGEPLVTGEDAFEAVRIGLAAAASARTAQPVTLS